MRTPAIATLAALLTALPACSRDENSADKPSAPAEGVVTHVYTVRGEVRSLPSATADLRVHHEAIPEYQGPGGVTGMGPMTMAFWPPIGMDPEHARVTELPLDGIETGDKVKLTFEVLFEADTDRYIGYYATSVTELPAETTLDFSPLPPRGE